MPEISRFYGITVYIYFNDHAPPHFHAVYGGQEAVFGIEDAAILNGRLPARAEKLIKEWAALRKTELRAAWNCAGQLRAPGKIRPLE
ncbi:MAG: DUF4160 domain-containing protein [Gammaproteobacteria bacterium]